MAKNYIEEAKKRLSSYGDSEDYPEEDSISSEERLSAWREDYEENKPEKESKAFWWFVLILSIVGLIIWALFRYGSFDSILVNQGMNISGSVENNVPKYIEEITVNRLVKIFVDLIPLFIGLGVLVGTVRFFNSGKDDGEYY